MLKFLYADELKDIFTVYGSYYDLLTTDGNRIKCRNILEIFRRSFHMKLSEPLKLFSSKPDSVFVMMNPGSSEPRQFGFREPVLPLNGSAGKLINLEMVFAKPDVTQYQVMRIMDEMKWDHVRIVNLSDIREPKSIKFFKRVKEFEDKYNGIHTIFSDKRCAERDIVFNMKEGISPVIIGWGRDRNLLPLAEKALKFLESYNTTGIVSPDHPKLYAHPSPNLQTAKIKWLEEIVSRLKERQVIEIKK
ncbi:MAG: hypothetical protein ABFR36_05225 [Acidobacteriota bacterium]